MERSKKMSKSSIAIIVLALLLAFSLVLGITGAWFTDSHGQEAHDTLTFGIVKVDTTGEGTNGLFEIDKIQAESTADKFLPGDKFVVDDVKIKNTGNVDAYVHYTYDLTITAPNGQDGTYNLADLVVSTQANAERVFVREVDDQPIADHVEELKLYEALAEETISGYDIVMNKKTFNVAFDTTNHIVYVLDRGHEEEALFSDVVADKNTALNLLGATYPVDEQTAYYTVVDLTNVEITVRVVFGAHAMQWGNVLAEDLNAWLEVKCHATFHAYADGTDANADVIVKVTGEPGETVETPIETVEYVAPTNDDPVDDPNGI